MPDVGALRPEIGVATNSRPISSFDLTLVLAVALTLTLCFASCVEDAFISFRYAGNLWAGHGPVFNVGERVQGYTHPLWLFALTLAMAALPPYFAAIALGLACTAITVACLAKVCDTLRLGTSALLLMVAVLFTSNGFLTFSTSGLENSLTHALLAGLSLQVVRLAEARDRSDGADRLAVARSQARRLDWLWLLAALLVLNRLDHALSGATLVLAGLWAQGGWRAWRAGWRGFASGSALLLGWLTFATLYYGMPLPNTAYAKVAETQDVVLAVRGLVYLADALRFEPLSSAVVVLGLVAGVRLACVGGQSLGISPTVARAVGFFSLASLAQVAYVVWVGGDYMRARFLTGPALLAVVVAALTIRWRLSAAVTGFSAGGLALASAAVGLAMALTHEPAYLRTSGIVDERLYWQQIRRVNEAQLLGDQALQGPERHALELFDARPEALLAEEDAYLLPVREYARRFGRRMALSDNCMGVLPYVLGPEVSVVDQLGLTDAFVARCPVDLNDRAGHLGRRIPYAYRQARGLLDVAPQALARVMESDPTLIADLEAAMAHPDWPNDHLRQRYEEIRLLTQGPIFDPDRLALIPLYALSRRSIDVPEGAEFPHAGATSSSAESAPTD